MDTNITSKMILQTRAAMDRLIGACQEMRKDGFTPVERITILYDAIDQDQTGTPEEIAWCNAFSLAVAVDLLSQEGV